MSSRPKPVFTDRARPREPHRTKGLNRPAETHVPDPRIPRRYPESLFQPDPVFMEYRPQSRSPIGGHISEINSQDEELYQASLTQELKMGDVELHDDDRLAVVPIRQRPLSPAVGSDRASVNPGARKSRKRRSSPVPTVCR